MNKPLHNQYTPDTVSAPGETLLEILENLGMTQAQLAERTGRPKKTINEIIKGKAAITPDTALQLERVLGVSASFWNQREQHYRESLARQAEYESLTEQKKWVNQFPFKKMVAHGWIEPHEDPVERLRGLLSFFGIVSPTQWEGVAGVAFRRAQVAGEPHATSVWLRQGERMAQQMVCQPYDSERFTQVLHQVRALTPTLPAGFDRQVTDWCAQAGVAVAFVPELPRVRISGAARWLSPHKALIQVSLRYKTDDQLWFTFFHEAGHILKHGKRDFFTDGDEPVHDAKEAEANTFAADFLIRPADYRQFIKPPGKPYSKEEIRRFAAQQGIAPGIVVGRLQKDGHLPHTHCNDLKRKLHWEPTPSPHVEATP